jgi:hypothetical protein
MTSIARFEPAFWLHKKNPESAKISFAAGLCFMYDNKATDSDGSVVYLEGLAMIGNLQTPACPRRGHLSVPIRRSSPAPIPPTGGWNGPRSRHPAAPGPRPLRAIVRNKANLPGPGLKPSSGWHRSYSDSDPDGARRNKPNFRRRRAWYGRRPANQRTPGGRGPNRVADRENTPRIRPMCMGRAKTEIFPLFIPRRRLHWGFSHRFHAFLWFGAEQS